RTRMGQGSSSVRRRSAREVRGGPQRPGAVQARRLWRSCAKVQYGLAELRRVAEPGATAGQPRPPDRLDAVRRSASLGPVRLRLELRVLQQPRRIRGRVEVHELVLTIELDVGP